MDKIVDGLRRLFQPANWPSWALLLWRLIDTWDTVDFLRGKMNALISFINSPLAIVLAVAWLFAVTLGWHKRLISLVMHTSPKSQVFDNRNSREWFIEKLKKTDNVWAAWLVGGAVENENLLEHSRFEKLVLLNPNGQTLETVGRVAGRSGGNLPQRIENLVKLARDVNKRKKTNTKIKFSRDLAYSLMTFGNPSMQRYPKHNDDAWVLLEHYLPGLEARVRPGRIVYYKDKPELYVVIFDSFQKLWKDSQEATEALGAGDSSP
jgi:hypothetical protein